MINHTLNIQQQSGADIIINTLMKKGVDLVFGYPGSPILPIYEALSNNSNIKHYLSRHEQGAIHAAEGYARVKGKCGIVLVTSGPGVTNTITGILNAYSDRTPLVVICAQSENSEKNEFQDVDVTKVLSGYTKKTYFVKETKDLGKTLLLAINDANKVPQGPVVLAVTKSALENKVQTEIYKERKEIKVEAPHSCVLRMLDKLQNAKRPLIIVGGGCSGAEDEVREFVNLTHAPVVNTLMATGVVGDLSFGLIGNNGIENLNSKIQSADVVIALGCRFSDRTTCYMDEFLHKSKIININIEQNSSKNIVMDEEILGELVIVLQQIIGTIKSKNIIFDTHYEWIDSLIMPQREDDLDSDCMSEQNVLRVISEYTKKYNPIITTDVGNHQIAASKIFKPKSSNHFVTSGGFGTMGFGLPAAVGASVARPDATVLCISGDGSFQMNIQELGMCAQYNLPVKIFIMNNSALGMIKNQQLEKGYNLYQSGMLNPDFVQIASSYGIRGYSVNSMAELKEALAQIFVYKKPVLLDIKVK